MPVLKTMFWWFVGVVLYTAIYDIPLTWDLLHDPMAYVWAFFWVIMLFVVFFNIVLIAIGVVAVICLLVFLVSK